MRDQWRPRAQTAALTRLTHEFRDHYSRIYQEERALGAVRRPQSKARARLGREHPERYRQLYIEECRRLAALPEGERFSDRPRHVTCRRSDGAT